MSPEAWKYPVAEPLFTDAFVSEVIEREATEGRKAKAYPTRLRFSDAGRCARAIAYDVLRYPRRQDDAAALHVMAVGTIYHEALQAALLRRYPSAVIEPKGIVESCSNSGHADAVVPETEISAVVPGWQGGSLLYELKTKGTYQFDQAVGILRKQWKPRDPKGPGHSVILQAGLNALAQGCETIAIGYVCFENYSLGLAERAGLRHMDRFLAEWHIGKDVWGPLVDAEIARLSGILATIDGGHLPVRTTYDDDGEWTELDPRAKKAPWQCDYCCFRDQCEEDGAGFVPLTPDFAAAEAG